MPPPRLSAIIGKVWPGCDPDHRLSPRDGVTKTNYVMQFPRAPLLEPITSTVVLAR